MKAKIKERLTENVKDEFEGIIKSLRHENQRLKDNLEQTGLIYQQHLKNIQQELEIEKEKLVTAMIRKQEQINQQHREEIKKQKHLYQEQLRKNDLIFQQAFNEGMH